MCVHVCLFVHTDIETKKEPNSTRSCCWNWWDRSKITEIMVVAFYISGAPIYGNAFPKFLLKEIDRFDFESWQTRQRTAFLHLNYTANFYSLNENILKEIKKNFRAYHVLGILWGPPRIAQVTSLTGLLIYSSAIQPRVWEDILGST